MHSKLLPFTAIDFFLNLFWTFVVVRIFNLAQLAAKLASYLVPATVRSGLCPFHSSLLIGW